jgi:hypothetical protein
MEKLQLFRGDTILIKVWFSDLRLLFQFFRVGVGYFVHYVGDLFEIWGYLRLKFVFHAYICIRACDVLCWVFRICELGVSFTSVISMCCWGCFSWSRVLVYWVYNIYIFLANTCENSLFLVCFITKNSRSLNGGCICMSKLISCFLHV